MTSSGLIDHHRLTTGQTAIQVFVTKRAKAVIHAINPLIKAERTITAHGTGRNQLTNAYGKNGKQQYGQDRFLQHTKLQ